MTAEEFTAWRNAKGLKRSEAARALGLAPNTIRAYEEKGHAIPLYVELACAALDHRANAEKQEVMMADIERFAKTMRRHAKEMMGIKEVAA